VFEVGCNSSPSIVDAAARTRARCSTVHSRAFKSDSALESSSMTVVP
jgi:hypothetical protein